MIGAFIQTNTEGRSAKGRPVGYVICENGCWEWVGAKDRTGYGFSHHPILNKQVRAHRYVWEQHRGPIPEGLVLDHLCRNRSCVRPDHLEPVTGTENILRGDAPPARFSRSTHCKRGHLLTPRRNGEARRECLECQNEWHRNRRRQAKNLARAS